MIDFRQALNIEGPLIGEVSRLLPKKFIEATQVFRTTFHRHVGDRLDGCQWPAAGTGQNETRGARWHLQFASDPRGRHQCRNSDIHHPHCVVEANARRQLLQHLSQGVFGEFAGDEVHLLRSLIHCGYFSKGSSREYQPSLFRF